jgi:integrase
LFRYAVDQEVLVRNPVAKIGREVEPDIEVEWIPKAHLSQLALAADDPVDKALLTVMAATGARFVQLLRLQWRHLHQDKQGRPVAMFRSRKTRGGKWRVWPQPLNAVAMGSIATLRGRDAVYVFPGRSGGPMIYNTMIDRLHKLCDRLELPRYSFHKVRHLAGHLTSAAGRNQKAIAGYLGHSNPSVTARYMHAVDPELWEIADAMQDEFIDLAGSEPEPQETADQKA